MRVQGEIGITRDWEAFYGKRIERLGRFNLRGHGARAPELSETIGDEENEHNEGTVRRAFDLKITEQGVGAEEVERFVNDIW